tara:strand:- start:3310 stop:4836 length:1527 start_codon:yes stop_codon:yes gene_type:complete
MPLVPINIPAGFYKNGTPKSQSGRWADGNLVRYHDGAIRPIGGWLRRTSGNVIIVPLIADASLEAIRDMFAWRDNTQESNSVYGSNLKLYHVTDGGVVKDITHAGYVPINSGKDAFILNGYGAASYGIGPYGVAYDAGGTMPIPPDRWYSTNFGEVLLTGVRNNGAMQELDIATLTLSGVTNAPADIQDALVSEERQVLAIGGDGEPRRFQASEVEDRTSWTPADDNQAIDRVIAGSGRLLAMKKVLNTVLILSETDATVAQYIGPPYVYSTSLVDEQCGPLAAEALTGTARFAVWWGQRNFWYFDGAVKKLDCEVIDFLYKDLNVGQASKISSFTATEFSEVWWLYQSLSSTTGEVDSYVTWNYEQNTWHTGRIDRTTGSDRGVLSSVTMVSSDGELYLHEQEQTIPSGEGDVYIESGFLAIGEKHMAVRYIYPDTENGVGTTYTLNGRQLPNATDYDYGPYAYQAERPIPCRAIGKLLKMRVDFSDTSAEYGSVDLDIVPVGTGGR